MPGSGIPENPPQASLARVIRWVRTGVDSIDAGSWAHHPSIRVGFGFGGKRQMAPRFQSKPSVVGHGCHSIGSLRSNLLKSGDVSGTHP